jgi:hypothetical protein
MAAATAATMSLVLLVFCWGGTGQILISPSFMTLNDPIYLADRKGIISICSINQWFDVSVAFASPGKCKDKIMDLGSGDRYGWTGTDSETADWTG